LAKLKNFKRCYNCTSNAQYDLEYNVNINKTKNIVEFKILDFKYPKINGHEKRYCGKCLKHLKLNPNSIEFISKIYNINNEVANSIILERNKSPFYKNNHKSAADYKKWQSRNKEWYVNKYGEEGKLKYEENIRKWQNESLKHNNEKDSMSLEHFIKKCNGDVEKAKKQKEKRHNSISTSLEKYIERYGKEEGSKKYFKKIEKLSYINTIKHYKERYGENLGIIKYNEWKNKCSISLDTFINKYGEEKGHIKYKQWLTGICKPLNKKFFSKESYNFFKRLQTYLGDVEITFGNDEIFIYDKNGLDNQHIFFYDAYIKKYNLIIEYDTPINHPNPNYLTEEEIKKTNYYNGNYEKDKFKENLALTNNYNFYRVFVKLKRCKKMN
jgi:hypothetical protein